MLTLNKLEHTWQFSWRISGLWDSNPGPSQPKTNSTWLQEAAAPSSASCSTSPTSTRWRSLSRRRASSSPRSSPTSETHQSVYFCYFYVLLDIVVIFCHWLKVWQSIFCNNNKYFKLEPLRTNVDPLRKNKKRCKLFLSRVELDRAPKSSGLEFKLMVSIDWDQALTGLKLFVQPRELFWFVFIYHRALWAFIIGRGLVPWSRAVVIA